MHNFIFSIDLDDDQLECVQREVDRQNAWEKENGYDGTWTPEKELRWSVANHLRLLEKAKHTGGCSAILCERKPDGSGKEDSNGDSNSKKSNGSD